MAKKVLTPEEFQAKLEKKAAKRNLFFGTFTKALAFFLAIAIAWSLAAIAFTPSIQGAIVGGTTTSGGAGTSNGGNGGASNGGGTNTTTPDSNAGTTTPNNDGGASNGGNAPAADSSEVANAVKALNDATAKVANGSYKWTRKCWFTSPIDVGDATDTLNGIIHRVDKNADLDSVVGGFLGITGKENDGPWEAPVTKGKFPAERNLPDKYLMKAFKLTEADVASCEVSGDKYTLTLKNCTNPQKDNSNALHHVTNDFITLTEVNEGISGALGALSFLVSAESCNVDFTNIRVVAEINGGNLKNVEISYAMDVKSLDLSIGVSGKGAGKMVCTYSNFS